MNPVVIVLILAAGAALMYFQYRQRQTVKALSDRLSRLLMEGRYDEFEELLRDRNTRVNLSDYNLQYLAFTEAMLLNRKKEADKAFDAMPGLRVNNTQKAAFYSRLNPSARRSLPLRSSVRYAAACSAILSGTPQAASAMLPAMHAIVSLSPPMDTASLTVLS